MAVLRLAGVAVALNAVAGHDSLAELPPRSRLRDVFDPWSLGSEVLDLTAPTVPSLGGRQLQSSGRCNLTLLTVFPVPSMVDYRQCVNQTMNKTNMRAPGAYFGVQAQCWCKHNMTAVVSQYNCQNEQRYSWLVDLKCKEDCSSEKVQACIASCPATCFEQEYVTATCKCEGCYEHLGCITERAQNDTAAGLMDPMCHEDALEGSAEYQNYSECETNHPTRTAWNRYNIVHHCACAANLTAAMRRFSCCGANWAKPICEARCSVNCSTQQARTCATETAELCTAITLNEVTPACTAKVNSCDDYKVCKPLNVTPTYPYICEDGTRPRYNGCCQFPSLTSSGTPENCPRMCSERRAYRVHDTIYCSCSGGCPRTMQEVNQVLNDAVFGNISIWTSGQQALIDIARQAGLAQGATPRMQEMMAQRNAEIQQAINAHQGLSNLALETEIAGISARWNARILEEARRYVACLSSPGQPACAVYFPPPPERGVDSTLVIVLVCVGAAALLLIFGILIMIYKIHTKRVVAASTLSPQAGDTNVVVGRPVESVAQTGFVGPTLGAPVSVTASARGKAGAAS